MYDNEPIKVWHKSGFTLRLWETGHRSNTGQTKLRYEFKDGRKVVFTGDDFGCSPMHGIDSLDSVYALLGFLAVGDGDTDADYFDDYSPTQIAWRDSDRREELGVMVYDREAKQN